MDQKLQNGSAEHRHMEGSTPMSSRQEAMERVRSAGAISMTPELFEKLYLTPKHPVKGDLRKKFGNPTPIALGGFLISLTPLSCDLMGWRGAGGNGAASIGSYYFEGGLLLVLGGILEWIIGNTFPSVVFCTFGGFYFAFGATLTPFFTAISSYAPDGSYSVSEGMVTQGFNASFGFFTLAMLLLSFMFLVCALRVNICFVIIFTSLLPVFGLLTGAYWALASDYTGNAAYAGKLTVGAGACAFVTAIVGWYVEFAIMLEVMDFCFQLPVGDLSHRFQRKPNQASSVV